MPATEPRLLTAQEIIDAADITSEVVPVPEWGGAVKLHGLSLDDVMDLRKQASDGKGEVDAGRMAVLLLVASCEVEFTPEQVEALRKKAAGPITRLIKRASELSGIDEDSMKDAERSFRD